jgi:putative peptidoglycan lipid II flippase
MNLLKAASTVSLFTLASRVTGLVRDQLIAYAFGAGAATDAFNVAFRIPNLFRRFFADGAFSQAFVPLLAREREAGGDAAVRSLIDATATCLLWVMVLFCAVGVVVAPVLVWLMASGLQQFDLAAVMTRWMFPYVGCMSLVALSAGILNTWRRFAVPAATPVLLNLSFIAGALWGAPLAQRLGLHPIQALAIAVMIGGVLQMAVQVPALRRLGAMPNFALAPARVAAAWRHPGVRRILALMAPAAVSVSVAPLSMVINTQIASHIAVGAVSWLTYADRLMEFPTALLGVALGVVLLPQLSSAIGRDDAQRFSDLLDWGLRLVVLLAMPCAVALMVMPEGLLAVLFHFGAFGAADVHQTARSLMGYGAGLLGIVAVKVLAPGYFARQDTRTPVKIALVVLAATQAFNAALVPLLGHAGLALSIGLGAMVNAGLLLRGLLVSGAYRPHAGWGPFSLRVALACAVLGAALTAAEHGIDWIGLQSHWLQRAGTMALVIPAAALLYFGVLAAAGVRLRELLRRA